MILYKYITVEKADEWLIGENSILLTPPVYLNDLLEFRVRREPADMTERRAMFVKFQREKPTSLQFEEFDRSITRREYVDREPEDMRRMLSDTYGVVSLTRDPLNELMWAHYGLNKGVAIGYRSDWANEHNGIKVSSLPIGMAMELQYTNEIIAMKKDFSDAARHLTTKRECWAYEREWRIIQELSEAREVQRDQKTFFAIPAKRDQIAHVVFGANAEAAFIERVKRWLGDTTACLQKVMINHESHELEFSDI